MRLSSVFAVIATLGLASNCKDEGQPGVLATIEPPPTSSNVVLSGKVTTANGVAVGGGVVEILAGTKVTQTATVERDGIYSVATLAPGSYSLRLQPALAYSIGPQEPDVHPVTIVAGSAAKENFIVQPAVYADDFQSYTTATLLQGCSQAIASGSFFRGAGHDMACATINNLSMDMNGGPNGTRAARYDWPGRPLTTTVASYCATENTTAMIPRFNPPPTLTNLWVRFTSKESPNFEHGSKNCLGVTGLAYKFFLIEFESGSTNARFGTYLINSTSNALLPTFLSTDMTDRVNTKQGGGFSLGGAGTSWGGAYHTWVMEMLGIGTSNATLNIYLDGVLMPGSISAPFLPGKTVGPGWALGISMGANINNGPDNPQSRWFRELGVYTTRPSTRPLDQ